MSWIIGFLILVVINALTLLIISRIPIGVEVDSPAPALLGGAIIGVFTGIWGFFPGGFQLALGLLSLGLIPLIGSMIVFGLAAWLVEGFRLRWGIWSLLLGAIAFALVNSILLWVLRLVGFAI